MVDCLRTICDNILLRTQPKTGNNGCILDISVSYLLTCVMISLYSIGVEGNIAKYIMGCAERYEFHRSRKTSLLLFLEEYTHEVIQKLVSHILVDKSKSNWYN